jgi:hypothetical protein
MYFFEPGQVQVQVYLSPSLPVGGTHYRYAVSFDDQAPQSVDMHDGLPAQFTDSAPVWEGWVRDNVIVKSTNLTLGAAGKHTLKLWMVDAGVVVQKVVVSRGAPPTSYLGPPTRLPLNTTIDEVVPDRGPDDPGAGGAGGAGGGTPGGASNAGGAANSGGVDSAGGATSSGGANAAGAPASSGGAANQPGGPGAASSKDSGCGCRTPGGARAGHASGALLALFLGSWIAGRRRRRDGAA